MLPLPPIVPVAFAMLSALVGGLIGSVAGWLTGGLQASAEIEGDTILGGVGFLLAFIISALVQWPTNTISYELLAVRR